MDHCDARLPRIVLGTLIGLCVGFVGPWAGSGATPVAFAAPSSTADRPLSPTSDREQRGGGRAERADKAERPERTERTEKAEKADRVDKPDNKADKAEVAESPAPPRPGLPDLGRLRAEYDRIREQLFKARVRSQKAAEAVYPSKMDARLRWKGGPDFVIRKARFLLDGAELWDSADRAQTDDLIEVSQRSVKPGPHALTVRLEIRPKTEAKGGTKTGAEKLGYTSEHTFAIVVADTGITHLLLTGDEDGDPPEYEPELELEIEIEK